MATRLTLTSGATRWRAVVDGPHVTVRDDAGGEIAVDVVRGVDGAVTAASGSVNASGCTARDGDRLWVWTGAHLFEFTIDDGRSRRRASSRIVDALAAPMPATVLRVNVTAGARVAEGDVLIALEAMKMELSIRAPRSGVISAVHCRNGDLVQPGTALVEYESNGEIGARP